jgi:hypothetical protein
VSGPGITHKADGSLGRRSRPVRLHPGGGGWALDAHAPVTNNTSAGVSIAEHQVFVAAGGPGHSSGTGYVIAYRAG